MKKFLPLLLLSAFLFLPGTVHAGLSEGCFPIVQCDPGQDFYAGACQSHIETLSNCPNPGAPTKYPAFSCDAGCYEMNYSVSGPASVCPGGIMVNGKCLIRLNVLDDTIDTFTAGNSAYKIWDGSALTEVVHVGNAGCANGQVAVSDTTSATGWKCENSAPGLWTKNGTNIYYNSGNVGIGDSSPTAKFNVVGTIRSSNEAAETNYIEIGNSSSSTSFINRPWSASGGLEFQIAGITRMKLDQSGNLGIGTAPLSYRLSVSGVSEFSNNLGYVYLGSSATGLVYSRVTGVNPAAGYFQNDSTGNIVTILGGGYGINATINNSGWAGRFTNNYAGIYTNISDYLGYSLYGTGKGYFGDAVTGAVSVTSPKFCFSSNESSCRTSWPSLTESDPQVGSLISGRWCTSDGSQVNCTSALPASPWTVSGSNVYRNTGYVGIGTSTPDARLTIAGTGYPSSFFHLRAGSGQDAGYRIYEGSTVKYHVYNAAGSDVFRIQPEGYTGLGVSSTGYVGIGTSSPGHLLHVTGRMKIDSTDAGMWIEAGTNDWFVGRLNSNDNTDLRFYNSTDKFIFGRDGRLEIVNGPDNDGSTASLIVGDGAQTLYVDGNEIDGSSSLYIQHNSSNNLYLATGGGNVGVGTTSPSAKLHVNGHLRATTLGNWTNVFDEKTLAANTSDHFIAYCPAGYIPVSCGMISGQQNQNPAVYAPTLYAYSTYCSAYVRNTSAFSYIIQVFVKCFNPNA